MVGRTISHYRVLEKLGEGGMGVVYKAEDTRLERIVALKFLREFISKDSVSRERFFREARTAASLDHPNIAQVFEVDEVEGLTFLAMAFIDGPSLTARIYERPLPVSEALEIAIQIADGLQAAHEKGVVHRDIKSENILLDSKGRPKITDFGLARLLDRSRLTKSGMTLGTVTHMSPEQARGMEVDRRTDLFSLGIVIYEMLTGQLPFTGEYDQAILYSVINEDPEPVTALRSGLPIEIDRILAKALAKDPEDRYQHADDMMVDLRSLKRQVESGESRTGRLATAATATTNQELARFRVTAEIPAAEGTRAFDARTIDSGEAVTIRVLPKELDGAEVRRLRWLIGGLGLLCVVLAVGFAWLTWGGRESEPPPRPVRRFTLSFDHQVAWPRLSPDGRYIVYTKPSRDGGELWVHDLERETRRHLGNTKRAFYPFWSPDSRQVGYEEDRRLWRIGIDDGTPTAICSFDDGYGLGSAWSSDGQRVVFSWTGSDRLGGGLFEVASSGGEPRLLEAADQRYYYPILVPVPGGDDRIIAIADGEVSVLLDERGAPLGKRQAGLIRAFDPAGFVLSLRQGGPTTQVWATAFEPKSESFSEQSGMIIDRASFASVDSNGTLVYLERHPQPKQLTWFDREGAVVGTSGQIQESMRLPSLSPDGRLLAVNTMEFNPGRGDIWLHEVGRALALRFTFDVNQQNYRAVWSPDSRQIIFNSKRTETLHMYLKGVGARSEESPLLTDFGLEENVHDWSRDGRYVLFHRVESDSASRDLWYLERTAAGEWEPHELVGTPFDEGVGAFSPDGNYVAYASDESGKHEIYVTGFPSGEGRWRVSQDGGTQPRWKDSGEIFFVQRDTLMAAPVSLKGELEIGEATPLFSDPTLDRPHTIQYYDVTADGKRFVLPKEVEGQGGAVVHVVENWRQAFLQ